MKPNHLLQIATDLAEVNTRRPRRADPARSAIGFCGGGCTVRSLEHRQARARCGNAPSRFPDEMREFGQTSADLQSKRHFAVYDPDRPIRKSDVVADINAAKAVIDRFLATSDSDRRDFAIHVLTKVRVNA